MRWGIFSRIAAILFMVIGTIASACGGILIAQQGKQVKYAATAAAIQSSSSFNNVIVGILVAFLGVGISLVIGCALMLRAEAFDNMKAQNELLKDVLKAESENPAEQ